MSPLRLMRPLVWLDLESTGLAPERDRIVEISIIKQFPDGRTERRTWRVNPGVPIPPDASAIHRIRDEDVAGAPPFAAIAPELMRVLEGCDMAGFGVARFDLLLLAAEFLRAHLPFDLGGRAVLDAQVVYHMKERRDLSAASRFYLGRDLEQAHDSRVDIEAARQVLEAQLERYPDLPRDARLLAEHLGTEVPRWADSEGRLRWERNEIVVGFGRHRGHSLRELARVQPDYLQWLLASDFADDFKQIVAAALRGEFLPPPPGQGPGGRQQTLELPPT